MKCLSESEYRPPHKQTSLCQWYTSFICQSYTLFQVQARISNAYPNHLVTYITKPLSNNNLSHIPISIAQTTIHNMFVMCLEDIRTKVTNYPSYHSTHRLLLLLRLPYRWDRGILHRQWMARDKNTANISGLISNSKGFHLFSHSFGTHVVKWRPATWPEHLTTAPHLLVSTPVMLLSNWGIVSSIAQWLITSSFMERWDT